VSNNKDVKRLESLHPFARRA